MIKYRIRHLVSGDFALDIRTKQPRNRWGFRRWEWVLYMSHSDKKLLEATIRTKAEVAAGNETLKTDLYTHKGELFCDW